MYVKIHLHVHIHIVNARVIHIYVDMYIYIHMCNIFHPFREAVDSFYESCQEIALGGACRICGFWSTGDVRENMRRSRHGIVLHIHGNILS